MHRAAVVDAAVVLALDIDGVLLDAGLGGCGSWKATRSRR